eukprot:PhM_4_TR3276/c0_g1_i1/m.106521
MLAVDELSDAAKVTRICPGHTVEGIVVLREGPRGMRLRCVGLEVGTPGLDGSAVLQRVLAAHPTEGSAELVLVHLLLRHALTAALIAEHKLTRAVEVAGTRTLSLVRLVVRVEGVVAVGLHRVGVEAVAALVDGAAVNAAVGGARPPERGAELVGCRSAVGDAHVARALPRGAAHAVEAGVATHTDVRCRENHSVSLRAKRRVVDVESGVFVVDMHGPQERGQDARLRRHLQLPHAAVVPIHDSVVQEGHLCQQFRRRRQERETAGTRALSQGLAPARHGVAVGVNQAVLGRHVGAVVHRDRVVLRGVGGEERLHVVRAHGVKVGCHADVDVNVEADAAHERRRVVLDDTLREHDPRCEGIGERRWLALLRRDASSDTQDGGAHNNERKYD